MSEIQMLKALVNERLNAAADEIFVVFERTIIKYKEEIDRQRSLLDIVLKPDICRTEEVPPEQQEQSPSLCQEDPEPPLIKEEQEELWTQGGEQLQGLEEADIINFSFTPVPVKSESYDEEKPQSSYLIQTRRDGNGAPLPSTSTEQVKTELEGEDCGASELDGNLKPANIFEPTSGGQLLSLDWSENDDTSEAGRDIREPQSVLNILKSKKKQTWKGQSLPFNKSNRSMELPRDLKSSNPPSICCKVCGEFFSTTFSLSWHVKVHSSACGLCGKHMGPTESIATHFEAHRTCDFCGKRCLSFGDLERHVTAHTGEKRYTCTVCGKRFGLSGTLNRHMRVHTGEKPYSCTICGKRFNQKGAIKVHMISHTGEKPYSCQVCNKSFKRSWTLVQHMRTHTGEKPFTCQSLWQTFYADCDIGESHKSL